MDEDEEAARQQSLVDLEQLYEWLQQFEDPTIGEYQTLQTYTHTLFGSKSSIPCNQFSSIIVR